MDKEKEVIETKEAILDSNVRANPTKFNVDGHSRLIWTLDVAPEVTKEHLENSEFYAGIANKLKPFHKIEVRAEDLTFYAEVLVIYATENAAKVKIINYVELEKASFDELKKYDKYEIKYNGLEKWCIIRRADGATVQKKLASQTDALEALKQYSKIMGK